MHFPFFLFRRSVHGSLRKQQCPCLRPLPDCISGLQLRSCGGRRAPGGIWARGHLEPDSRTPLDPASRPIGGRRLQARLVIGGRWGGSWDGEFFGLLQGTLRLRRNFTILDVLASIEMRQWTTQSFSLIANLVNHIFNKRVSSYKLSLSSSFSCSFFIISYPILDTRFSVCLSVCLSIRP